MKKGMLVRIIVGTLLTLVFAAVWYFGGVVQTVLYTIIALLCGYEICHVLGNTGKRICKLPIYIASAAVAPMVTYLDIKWYFYLLFIMALIVILVRLCNANGKNEDMLYGLLALVYPLCTLAILIKVSTIDTENINRLTMFITYACPLLGDTLAYFFGVSMGKRKLCEHISPKKTIAGSVGGIIGGGLGGVAAYFLQFAIPVIFNLEAAVPINILPLVLLGLVLGIIGQIGDLFASCIKRWAQVKDYGTIFPGHGGMMDRIDSVMMCAPIVLAAFDLILI